VKNGIFTLFAVKFGVGGTMVSWLVHQTPDRAIQVQALAGDIALCSWARHLTPTVPLSTQVYKCVLVNLMVGVTSIPSRRSRNIPCCFMIEKLG